MPSVCEISKTLYLKGGDGDFLFFLYHFSLAVKHGLSRFGVDFINQLFHLVGRGGKDFNAFLAFLYMAVKLLFPLTEAITKLPPCIAIRIVLFKL